jgi:hypothetical protein
MTWQVSVTLTALGTVGLRGWRTKVADTLAPPIAGRLPVSEDQVRAAIGALFLALAVKYVVEAVADLSRR